MIPSGPIESGDQGRFDAAPGIKFRAADHSLLKTAGACGMASTAADKTEGLRFTKYHREERCSGQRLPTLYEPWSRKGPGSIN